MGQGELPQLLQLLLLLAFTSCWQLTRTASSGTQQYNSEAMQRWNAEVCACDHPLIVDPGTGGKPATAQIACWSQVLCLKTSCRGMCLTGCPLPTACVQASGDIYYGNPTTKVCQVACRHCWPSWSLRRRCWCCCFTLYCQHTPCVCMLCHSMYLATSFKLCMMLTTRLFVWGKSHSREVR